MRKIFLFAAALLLLASVASADAMLPRGAEPVSYSITINPDPSSLAFAGKERILIRVLDSSKTITLNSLQLKLTSAEVSGKLLPKPMSAAVATDDKAETATLSFPRPLKKGIYALDIAWSGTMDIKPRGLFYSDYPVNGKVERMIATQFESVDARRMFPCWDEPAYKAVFQLNATVPGDWLAVSNMPILKESRTTDGKKFVRFLPTPKMSSYLLAFVEGKLESIGGKADGIALRVIAPPDRVRNGEFALHAAEKFLHYYDRYYGIKYPLPKLDLIDVPGSFGGAMENWGAITFDERDLLYDPANSSQDTMEDVANTVAHEMAHQWTGDLVTMKWWDDLWLNEGFADWMADKITDKFFPAWRVELRSIAETHAAMVTDSLSATHPIVRPVPSGREADDAFDEITYNKGEAVIKMIESYLGEETFRKGIDRYLRAHEYSNATSKDLWAALSSASRREVEPFALGWIRQPGFPEVIVRSECRNGAEKIKLTQEPFALLPPDKAPPGDGAMPTDIRTWEIPVTVHAIGEQNAARFLLAGKKEFDLSVSPCPVPLILSDQGYYRVMYDKSLFETALSNIDRLTEAEQAHLLYDTGAFMEQGAYPASYYLKLVKPMSRKTDLAVWEQILHTFQTLDNLETNPKGKEEFRAYAKEILRPAFLKLGWDAKPGEPENTSLLRADLIEALGRYGDKEIITEAGARFQAFMKSPESLPPALRPPVLRIVGIYANQATFDRLHALALKASSSEEKNLLYNALESASDPALAAEALKITMTNERDPVDSMFGILTVAYEGKHPDLAWNFARQNIGTIMKTMPSILIGDFFGDLISSFFGANAALDAASFAKQNLPPIYNQDIAKAIARNSLWVHLREKLVPQIEVWVDKNG